MDNKPLYSYDSSTDEYELLQNEIDLRAQKIINMCHSVEELNEAMKEINTIISSQQESIDTIENNMIAINTNAKKGNEEIEIAKTYYDQANKYKYVAGSLLCLGISPVLGVAFGIKIGLISLGVGMGTGFYNFY